MSEDHDRESELVAGALAWLRRRRELICDQIDPWEHGTVYRARRYPVHSDFNVVRVHDDPGMSVGELIGFADRALAGLEYRRVDFDSALVAEPLRSSFEAHGFKTTRLVWMHYEGLRPGAPGIDVTEVPFDAITDLRAAWHHEDFPGRDASEFLFQAREVRLALGTRVLAVFVDSRPVGFAALDLGEHEIEIGALYVLPQYRGQGRGTALAQAAITAAGDVEHLWICADDEDRPKHLYARLGFRLVLTMTEFLRLT